MSFLQDGQKPQPYFGRQQGGEDGNAPSVSYQDGQQQMQQMDTQWTQDRPSQLSHRQSDLPSSFLKATDQGEHPGLLGWEKETDVNQDIRANTRVSSAINFDVITGAKNMIPGLLRFEAGDEIGQEVVIMTTKGQDAGKSFSTRQYLGRYPPSGLCADVDHGNREEQESNYGVGLSNFLHRYVDSYPLSGLCADVDHGNREDQESTPRQAYAQMSTMEIAKIKRVIMEWNRRTLVSSTWAGTPRQTYAQMSTVELSSYGLGVVAKIKRVIMERDHLGPLRLRAAQHQSHERGRTLASRVSRALWRDVRWPVLGRGGGLAERSRDERGPEFSIFVGDLGTEVNEYVLHSLFNGKFPSCKSAKISIFCASSTAPAWSTSRQKMLIGDQYKSTCTDLRSTSSGSRCSSPSLSMAGCGRY
ncbi:hypothetical protein BLS_005191 [Venturia inaequalis]|uniref:Uncharacterized protein n=1 Tax=Venturia inaequalis TaxID=5025 RepID=A0A8H3UIM7_VENIN|nr:hypothetical protein BLS_005191 [Venturia inaequalis]